MNLLRLAACGRFARRAARGVTMIESLCVTSVVATAAGLAAPSMTGWKLEQTLRASADELRTDIHYARAEAIARQRTVRLTVQPLGPSSCYMLHTGGANDCQCSGQGIARCQGDAALIRLVEQPADGSVRLSNRASSIAFDPGRGTVTPTATLKLVDGQGRAIHQVVNIMGRARACSPGRTVSGLAAC